MENFFDFIGKLIDSDSPIKIAVGTILTVILIGCGVMLMVPIISKFLVWWFGLFF